MKQLSLILAICLLSGCYFRPLEEYANVSYVRVYVDESMLNVTKGFYDESIREKTGGAVDVNFQHPDYAAPEILRIGLFDVSTGELVIERYLRNQGKDERGRYFDGHITINPGTYNLVVYNFGTESTVIDSEQNCYKMLAYTHEIAPAIKSQLKTRSESDIVNPNEVIRYDADPLFVASAERIVVPFHSTLDTLRDVSGQPWFQSTSLVKCYYLQIGVIGAQYISSSACLLTGMAESTHTLEPDYEKAEETTLYFKMNQGVWPKGYRYGYDEFHCIYTTFGTFGCLPDAAKDLKVSLEFVTTYGAQIDTTFHLSTEFLREDAIERQWILPDFEIKIPPPPSDSGSSDGGIAPSVGDWDEINSNLDV